MTEQCVEVFPENGKIVITNEIRKRLGIEVSGTCLIAIKGERIFVRKTCEDEILVDTKQSEGV